MNMQMPSPDEMAQQLAHMNQLNFNRSRVHFGELVDAIAATCLAAEQGDPGAKQDLKQLLATLERAKSASVGVIYGGGNNGNPG